MLERLVLVGMREALEAVLVAAFSNGRSELDWEAYEELWGSLLLEACGKYEFG